RLASGREVDATANHRFRTIDGWTPLGELAPGSFVAVPRVVAELQAVGATGLSATAAVSADAWTAVGCHGARGAAIPEARRILDGLKPNPNLDLVPWPVAAQVKRALADAGMSHRELAGRLCEPYCGSYLLGSPDRPRRFSRSRLERIADTVGDAALHDLATSDVLWDEVVGITSIGEQPTFDATVEGTHNFIADGIVAHNSLEQDADVVMFLYRDEIYNAESPDRGTAEIIVSKHRNGPTGVCQLAFLNQYTRFANMARI
ncbi:MAG: DnaB-like helicase C-terminal domain-containing protein, partial [Acidimicrobiales bacterium]